MATQQVKIKVNNKNQVKFNVQPQKIKFNVNTNGRPGKDGEPPEFQIGTVSTLSAGESAKVEIDENSTKYNQILNFGIPQGVPGADGYTPVKGLDYFDGEIGPQGPQGEQGLKGEDYIITDDDYAAIVSRALDQVNPVLEANLEQSKAYADSVKPTKTSELTNDSNFAVTNQNNNFSTGQTINGTLTINGDIVQNGESYVTHAEEVHTKNDEIITREGATGGLSEGAYSGIVAQKYDGENDGRLGFNANGEARVGDVGDEQPLLTRDEVVNLQDGQVLVWDGTNLKAVGSSSYVKDTDYGSTSKAGVVKGSTDYGTYIRSNGVIQVQKATDDDIDGKTNTFKPIVPSNLDYAVKSVGDGYYVKNTEFATSTKTGVVRCGEGLYMSSSTGKINVEKATEANIDAKATASRPIVPYNLDYAIRAGLADNKLTWSETQKRNARDLLGIATEVDLTQAEYDALETKDENTYYNIVEE